MPTSRRTRQATKEIMLTAGTDVLLRDGISVGASTFRYADAFALLAERNIKVTRGSVHQRIWPSQEAWQLEVIGELIERNERARRKTVRESTATFMAELRVDTPQQRRHALAESCRVSSKAFIDEVLSSPEQRLLPTVVAAWKASSSAAPEHTALGDRLCQLQTAITTQYLADFTELADYLKLGVNPDRGLSRHEAIRAFCAATSALGYSHSIRIPHDPALSEPIMAQCPDGQRRPWTILAMGNWLIAEGLFTYTTDAEQVTS